MSLNNKEPLVSIAIITYNQKEFLKECIESCLAQDYPNLEIVVADDGSTDGTHDLLNDYDIKHPGKFVLRLSKENQGITKNSNAAHFACRGKYIAWMGGDDLMLPGKISSQVEYMENNPNCSIVYHDLDVFDSQTNSTLYLFSKIDKPREGDVVTAIKYGSFNGACSTMVRASKAPKLGFDKSLIVASDWFYWIETLHAGGEIRYIDKVLGRYRRHSGNVTKFTGKVGRNYVDTLNTLNLVIKLDVHYLRSVMFSFARIYSGLRHVLDYNDALIFSLKFSFSLKALGGLLLSYVSFGYLKF